MNVTRDRCGLPARMIQRIPTTSVGSIDQGRGSSNPQPDIAPQWEARTRRSGRIPGNSSGYPVTVLHRVYLCGTTDASRRPPGIQWGEHRNMRSIPANPMECNINPPAELYGRPVFVKDFDSRCVCSPGCNSAHRPNQPKYAANRYAGCQRSRLTSTGKTTGCRVSLIEETMLLAGSGGPLSSAAERCRAGPIFCCAPLGAPRRYAGRCNAHSGNCRFSRCNRTAAVAAHRQREIASGSADAHPHRHPCRKLPSRRGTGWMDVAVPRGALPSA